MLSAGRGLLGQTHGGTHTIPWTSTFFSGKEGWFLIISLFILISLPHGTAWPYGKRLTETLPSLLFFLPLCLAQPLGLCSLFSKSQNQHSLHPLFPAILKCSARLVKEDPQKHSDVKYSLLQRQQRTTALTSLCNLCCYSSRSEMQREGLSCAALFIVPLRGAL